MLDRVVLTILFMAAILRPTRIDWIWSISVVIVWLIWEGMILIEEKYLCKKLH